MSPADNNQSNAPLPIEAYAESMRIAAVDDWYLDPVRERRRVRDWLHRLTVFTLAAAQEREDRA